MARLIQRPKYEDIDITAFQKRYEPFWTAAAVARYVYDRRHTYRIDVAPEVQRVTVHDVEHLVVRDRGAGFEVDAVEHCVEEFRHELILDAEKGQEADLAKYLRYTLAQGDALVVPPQVRASFVVRKLVSLLLKTFQADVIHEERIDVEHVSLLYRPVYAVEYFWKTKDKRQVLEFDALTGDVRSTGGEIKRQVVRILENDALFDIGADAVGTLVPGAGIAVKLGRLAARKVVR